MGPRRYEITEFEWSIIAPLLPNKPRGVPRVDDRRVLNGIFLAIAHRLAVGRHPGALRPAGRPATTASSAGESLACGTASSRQCRAPMMAAFRWSTARRSEFISTRPTSKRGGRRRPAPGTSLQPDAWGARGAG